MGMVVSAKVPVQVGWKPTKLLGLQTVLSSFLPAHRKLGSNNKRLVESPRTKGLCSVSNVFLLA